MSTIVILLIVLLYIYIYILSSCFFDESFIRIRPANKVPRTYTTIYVHSYSHDDHDVFFPYNAADLCFREQRSDKK